VSRVCCVKVCKHSAIELVVCYSCNSVLRYQHPSAATRSSAHQLFTRPTPQITTKHLPCSERQTRSLRTLQRFTSHVAVKQSGGLFHEGGSVKKTPLRVFLAYPAREYGADYPPPKQPAFLTPSPARTGHKLRSSSSHHASCSGFPRETGQLNPAQGAQRLVSVLGLAQRLRVAGLRRSGVCPAQRQTTPVVACWPPLMSDARAGISAAAGAQPWCTSTTREGQSANSVQRGQPIKINKRVSRQTLVSSRRPLKAASSDCQDDPESTR
jgi:hypothetical protein